MGVNGSVIRFVVGFGLCCCCACEWAVGSKSADLTVVNGYGGTLLVVFSRSCRGKTYTKLVESSEVVRFGKVYEASIQAYSGVWRALAPAEHTICSCERTCQGQPEGVTVFVRGITGRGLLNPFGSWNCQTYSGGGCQQQLSCASLCVSVDNVLCAFPTVRKKAICTPRNVLGLPSSAGIDDAYEAAKIVQATWDSVYGAEGQKKQQFSAGFAYAVERAVEAFARGKPDEVLHVPLSLRHARQRVPELVEVLSF